MTPFESGMAACTAPAIPKAIPTSVRQSRSFLPSDRDESRFMTISFHERCGGSRRRPKTRPLSPSFLRPMHPRVNPSEAGRGVAQAATRGLEPPRCGGAQLASGTLLLHFPDFLQYYLGAYLYNEDAGTTSKGTLYDVIGVDNPFNSLSWSFGSPGANNQDASASFIATSGILPKAQFPQFDSWFAAKYLRPGGPFDPHTGTYYAYSNIADISYKRLTRTISVPAGGANLSFWISRDTEPDWDFTL